MLYPFSRKVLFAIAAMAMVTGLPPAALPALNESAVSTQANGPYELVVVEVEGCTYCEVFRRDVMPAFAASPEARELPIRFLDLNTPDAQKLELTDGPLTVVPTVLLVRANKEVARASGYMGPDGFFQAVRWMMGHAR